MWFIFQARPALSVFHHELIGGKESDIYVSHENINIDVYLIQCTQV